MPVYQESVVVDALCPLISVLSSLVTIHSASQ